MLASHPKPLSRTFLVESAYEAILENILSGALPSGTLVSEVSLAQDLQVSRTPVHQALSRLAKEVLKALADRHPASAGQAMARHVQKRLDAVLGTLYREAK